MMKHICCALLLLTTSLSSADDAVRQSPTTTPIFTAAGAFFALSVSNLDASAKWYSEKLGLKVVMQPPKANQAAVVVLEGGGLIVELIQHDGSRPLKAAASVDNNVLVHGIFKAGIIVGDLDRTVAALKQRGVTLAFGPFPRTAGQRANAAVRDNEGNLIQFFGK